MNDYSDLIAKALPHCVTETHLTVGKKMVGKVRDVYDCGNTCVIVTTDRVSAFDRVLAAIPFKGRVLNQCSAFWFEKTKHIIANHVISVSEDNITVAKKCEVLPIEFVVRGYITGTTSTALWTQYKSGVRHYCGQTFPEGLKKNQPLEKPVLTPTTKEAQHDRPISPEEIVKEGWLSQADWDYVSQKALELYTFGAALAKTRGLILVDTKYEFGRDKDGNILLIDEVHTPDSSRYWFLASYLERFNKDEEPESFDKEFLRRWFVAHCDPYHDKVLPKAPDELIIELSQRYLQLYEQLTGLKLT